MSIKKSNRLADNLNRLARAKEGRHPSADSKKWMDKLQIPQTAFLIIGSVFGLAFLVVTPPFGIPDEQVHFYRAFQVSELSVFRAIPQPSGDSLNQAWLPKSLAAVADSTEFARTRFNPHEKVKIKKVISALSVPLNANERQVLIVAPYSPIAYMPQAIGIALARVFGFPPLILFYVGRFFALAAWIFLVYLSIKSTPVLKWVFFLLALMPMSVFQAASNSADSLIFGTSFFLIATFFKYGLAEKQTIVGRKEILLLCLLLIIMVLSKPVYFLLILLFFTWSFEKFKSKKEYFLAFFFLLVVGLTVYFLSGLISGVWPQRTQSFIPSDPIHFARIFINTIEWRGEFYTKSFVGQLGWMDTYLPNWLIYGYLAALVTTSIIDRGVKKTSVKTRFISIGVFVVAITAIFVYFYLNVTAPGDWYLEGVQGRYFIPVAPLLFLAFSNKRIILTERFFFKVTLVTLTIICLSTSLYALTKRFYWETVPSYQIELITTNPSQDAYLFKGWAIDERSYQNASGLMLEIGGKLYPANYGIRRDDLAARYKSERYRFSGFEVLVRDPELISGKYFFSLIIRTRDGKTYHLPPERFILRLTRREP